LSFAAINFESNFKINHMIHTKKEALNIVGIATRTLNKPGKADKDIPQLWNKFMAENTLQRIPNK